MLTQPGDKLKPRNCPPRPLHNADSLCYQVAAPLGGHPQGATCPSRLGDRLTVGQRTLTPPV
jgi:hypothetical protein